MDTQKVTRRGFLGLGAAGVAFGLAGCAPSGAKAGAGSAKNLPKNLQVAQWGDSTRAGLYEQASKLFTASHKGSSIKLQYADLGPYLDRLATQAAAHKIPDVVWMRDTHIGRYGSSHALLDLSPYLGHEIDTDPLGEAAVADGRIGKGVYALPTHFVGQAVISNKDMVGAKGIDPSKFKHWDDLAAAAKEMVDPSKGIWGIGDPTLNTTHRHLEAWIRQSGEELFNKKGGPGFTKDTVEAWYEFWSKLRAAKVIPPADVEIEADSGGSTTNFLVTGKSGLMLDSTNHLTSLQQLTDNPLQLSSIPQVKNSTRDWWFFPPILISAAANTKNLALAAQLINFYINNVPAAKITRLNEGAPSSSTVRKALGPSLQPAEKAFIDQISREQKNPSRPLPIRPEGAEQLDTILTQTGQQIAYGRQSVSAAVSALMTAAKQALPET